MKVLSSVTSSHVKKASQLQTGRNQYRPTKSYGWRKWTTIHIIKSMLQWNKNLKMQVKSKSCEQPLTFSWGKHLRFWPENGFMRFFARIFWIWWKHVTNVTSQWIKPPINEAWTWWKSHDSTMTHVAFSLRDLDSMYIYIYIYIYVSHYVPKVNVI